MHLLMSFLCYAYFFVTAAMLSTALVLLTPFTFIFDRNKKLLHEITSLWGYHFVMLNPWWKCLIEGAEYLEPDKAYVIVANHQSLADVFVLAGLKHNFKWVSKESLLRIPFFGWNMKLNNYVSLKRGDRKSIKEMMSGCKAWLEKGVSIMMFPEGTRSEDGCIGDFRDGSFRLSLDCDVPIVPIVITGTRELIAKHSIIFNFNAKMKVKVLPPVLPAAFEKSPGKMREYVHDLMVQTMGGMLQ